MNEQKIEQALEMARCADCNMDNLAKWQPTVTSNPMFTLVRAQLRSAIGKWGFCKKECFASLLQNFFFPLLAEWLKDGEK